MSRTVIKPVDKLTVWSCMYITRQELLLRPKRYAPIGRRMVINDDDNDDDTDSITSSQFSRDMKPPYVTSVLQSLYDADDDNISVGSLHTEISEVSLRGQENVPRTNVVADVHGECLRCY